MAKKKIEKDKLKGSAKGFIAEFKAFVLRGNVMDMAIGVIIGSAFAAIVTALTDDFINPLINGKYPINPRLLKYIVNTIDIIDNNILAFIDKVSL